VNSLRVRVEAEDKLIELEALAKADRKRARKEEKMREAEEARQREHAELNLVRRRRAHNQLASLGINVTSPNGTQRAEAIRFLSLIANRWWWCLCQVHHAQTLWTACPTNAVVPSWAQTPSRPRRMPIHHQVRISGAEVRLLGCFR
jgi:hypothetical protein